MGAWGDWLIGLSAVLVAAGVIWKVVVPCVRKGRRWGRSIGRMRDVLLGKPEVPDPDRPGQLLEEAVPDLGVRVTRVEDLVARNIVTMMETTHENAASAKASASASAESARAAAESAETSRLATIEQSRRIGDLESAVEGFTGRSIPRRPHPPAEDGWPDPVVV